MMKYIPIAIVLASFFALTACKEDEVEPFVDGSDYIPLTQGAWYEYQLDSVILNDVGSTVDTMKWDLRIEVGEPVTKDGDESFVRLLRSQKRRGSTRDYQFTQSFFATIENGRYVTIEDNLRFIKLVFPPVKGKTWRGNEFVSLSGNDNPNSSTRFYEGWDYEYASLGQSLTVNNNNFDDVLHVQQVDDAGGPGAINHFVASEWYAKDVGLVKKRMEMVVENCGGDNCSEKDRPVIERDTGRKGFILEMTLTDFEVK